MNNIYLLISKDEYLIKKRLNEILTTFNANDEMLEVYDLEERPIMELLGELTTVSVFDDYRFFWVKNTTALTKRPTLDDASLEALIKYIKSPVDSSILIFSSTDYAQTSELAKELKKVAIIEELEVSSNTLEGFLRNFVQKENMNMKEYAINDLLLRFNDYQTLENELLKLKFYADGEEITSDMINKVVSKNIDSKVYEITNAILAKDKKKAISLYYELLEANEEPSRIFSNIMNKMLELLYVKKMIEKKSSKEEIAESFNVSQGRAYYMMKNAGEISMTTLERYLNDLSELNYQARSGNIDEKTGIELFILKA